MQPLLKFSFGEQQRRAVDIRNQLRAPQASAGTPASPTARTRFRPRASNPPKAPRQIVYRAASSSTNCSSAACQHFLRRLTLALPVRPQTSIQILNRESFRIREQHVAADRVGHSLTVIGKVTSQMRGAVSQRLLRHLQVIRAGQLCPTAEIPSSRPTHSRAADAHSREPPDANNPNRSEDCRRTGPALSGRANRRSTR